MKSLKTITLASLLFFGSSQTKTYEWGGFKCAWSEFSINEKEIAKYCLITTCAIAGIILFKKMYNTIQDKIEDKIIEKIADTLYLILTPNHQLNNEQLKQKTKIICSRKRVFKQFQSLYPNYITQICSIGFNIVDSYRNGNPYEKYFENPTHLDLIVEKRILDSICLTLKENKYCTKQELATKQKSKIRRQKVLKFLTTKYPNCYTNGFNNLKQQATLLFSIFFNS